MLKKYKVKININILSNFYISLFQMFFIITVCPSDLSEWITPSADNTSFQVLFVVQNAKRDQSQTGCAGHSSSLVKINALWKQNALAASLENCDGRLFVPIDTRNTKIYRNM
jgi:hypothetical protein